MKNNKILIGYNYELEAHEQRQSTAKEVAKNNLVKYVTNVCKLQPTDDFTTGDILSNFKALFLDKWSNSLPDGLEYDKMLFLASIDYNKLLMLVDEFNKIEVTGQTDFGIYATTPEQVEKFKALSKVCDAVHSSQTICHVFLGNVLGAYSGKLVMNHRTNKLMPNPYFILDILK
jgi:hypothetical protein